MAASSRAIRFGVLLALLGAGPAAAQDLMSLLEGGPVVMVKQDAEGGFDRSTAVIHVRARPEVVWAVLADFERYVEFMPKLRSAEVVERGEASAVVAYEIETPGRNTRYTYRYEMLEPSWEIRARWVSGDLRGSFGNWRLVLAPGGTLVYFTGATRNFSRVLAALEDDQQTITIGVNVASALAMVRAVRDRSEALAAQAAEIATPSQD
jgi:ribosome-associated toxin RatA of RatAB toxin-antitoxin module